MTDLFTLPLNTSHLLQLLDVAVYGPMKTACMQIPQQHKKQMKGANVDKKVFASLLSELLRHSMTLVQLRAGFRATGISPFNPVAIPCTQAQSTTTAPAPTVTPIRMYLTVYFSNLLQPEQPEVDAAKASRSRLCPAYHGEALTYDELVECIHASNRGGEEGKEGRTEWKKRKKNEIHTRLQHHL